MRLRRNDAHGDARATLGSLIWPLRWSIRRFGRQSIPRYPFLGGAVWPH